VGNNGSSIKWFAAFGFGVLPHWLFEKRSAAGAMVSAWAFRMSRLVLNWSVVSRWKIEVGQDAVASRNVGKGASNRRMKNL
jgi:hypothetical protein